MIVFNNFKNELGFFLENKIKLKLLSEMPNQSELQDLMIFAERIISDQMNIDHDYRPLEHHQWLITPSANMTFPRRIKKGLFPEEMDFINACQSMQGSTFRPIKNIEMTFLQKVEIQDASWQEMMVVKDQCKESLPIDISLYEWLATRKKEIDWSTRINQTKNMIANWSFNKLKWDTENVIYEEEESLKMDITDALSKLAILQKEKELIKSKHHMKLVNENCCPNIAKLSSAKHPYHNMDPQE